MDLVIAIARMGVLPFGLTLLLVLLGTLGLGALAGARVRERTEQQSQQISFAVNGMLGLLAFILGLTLVMSQGRYEEIRRTTFQEATAIGSAWQWTYSLDHPRAPIIAGLLEDYLAVRAAFVSAEAGNRDAITLINLRTDALQGEIWGHAVAIARERTDFVAVQLLTSLNGTFDAATELRWAFSDAVLVEIFWLVMACSLLTIGGMGYQFGMIGLRRPVAVLALIAAQAAATTVIFDLATPRLGSLRADVRPYEWTQQAFRGGVTIPPMAR